MFFWVDGEPQGEPRPRATAFRGHVRVYTTKNPWRDAVARRALEMHSGPPLEGAVGVRIVCYFRRPQRLLRKKDSPDPILHTAKPDGDNVAKAALDAMSGILYRDDRQVAAMTVRKYYAPKPGEPGIDDPGAAIEVWSMQDD